MKPNTGHAPTLSRGLRRLCVLAALAGAPATTQAQIPCLLAPYGHKVICRYLDPGLMKGVVQTATVEMGRWAGLKIFESTLNALDARLDRGQQTIAAYDSALRDLKEPRVPVPVAFAAAFNAVHPDAIVRLTFASGRVVAELNVAAAADSALASQRAARGGDPLRRRAQALGKLATLVAGGGGETGNVAAQVSRIFNEQDSTAVRSDTLARRATAVAGRALRYADDAGESDAIKVGAKARLDRLRTAEALMHADNMERTITALQRTQRARAAQQHALEAYFRSKRGEW